MWESFTSSIIIINMVTANITNEIITSNDTANLLEYCGLLASNLVLFLLMTIVFLGFRDNTK